MSTHALPEPPECHIVSDITAPAEPRSYYRLDNAQAGAEVHRLLREHATNAHIQQPYWLASVIALPGSTQ